MSVVLAAAVERAVTTAFTRLNGQVEAAVLLEVDRRLEQLAVELLAARLDPHPDHDVDQVHEAAKTCRACGQEKAVSEFEKHRATCRQCRREQARGKTFATAEADRPTVGPQPE